MDVVVFLDTNIIESDFKLKGTKFQDLLNAKSKYKFKLYLTEMNYLEVISHYKKIIKKFSRELNKAIINVDKLVELSYVEISRESQEEYIKEYERKIQRDFEIYVPTTKVYKNSFDSYFKNKRPFQENKEEHRDSLIWETIFEYAQNNKTQKIIFISQNHKDFAKSSQDFTFHSDYDTLDGRIIYKNNIIDFLTYIDYLVPSKISKDVINKVLEYIVDHQINDQSSEWNFELETEFENSIFILDNGFEGWGYEPELNAEYLDIDEDEILKSHDIYHIPVYVTGSVSYYVQFQNPTYEKGDESSLIESDIQNQFCKVKMVIIYNESTGEVEGLEEIDW